MIRTVLAIMASILASVCVVAALETLGHLLFPPPPGLDIHDPEQARRLLQQLSLGAYSSVIAAWVVGIFVGVVIAIRCSKGRPIWSAIPVLLLMGGSALATLAMLPHPLWFMVVVAILTPFAAVAGILVARWSPRRITPADR